MKSKRHITAIAADRDEALYMMGQWVQSVHKKNAPTNEKVQEGYEPYYEGEGPFQGMPYVQICGVRVYYKEKQ